MLSVKLRNVPIKGSPFAPSVSPAQADPATTCVEGSGLRKAVKGEQSSFRILAKDEFGNRCVIGGQRFRLRVRQPLSGSERTQPEVSIADLGNGTHLASWVPSSRGRHLVSVALGDVCIVEEVCLVT